LGAIERLERALALLLVMTWRIVHLMQTGRRRPEVDAEPFFDADEIRSACFLTDVKQPAWSKLNEALRLTARQVDSLAAKATANPVRKPSGCDSKEVHVASKEQDLDFQRAHTS
jgi:hypothetical protein